MFPPAMPFFVQQSLSDRLSQTATSLSPWPERPVPIALVITDLNVGGAEQAMASLATRLERTRWKPTVVCLGNQGQLVEVLAKANVPCECLDASRRRPGQVIGRLARRLRQIEPQLIQSFMFHANLAARLAAVWIGGPWLVSGLRVAEHQKRWHLIIDRLTAPLATGSVCVSEGVRRFSRDVARLEPARLTVIPNGIDPAPFDSAIPLPRAAIGLPETAHLALYLGRLDVQKGLHDLLRAAERVVSHRPQWHLALAGDGPSRDWLLQHLTQCTQLQGNVHWLGYRNDVPSLLKSADVLVHASLWEGMPNAVLEAMAASRPVIGTRVEGTEDLVVPGQTGWLVPPRDFKALSHALIEADESPSICRRYGEAGRLRVEQEFSINATVKAYERLWAGVLGLKLTDPSTGSPNLRCPKIRQDP
jgi:glycosyltransferase involved in cell wall biosynthesis